MSTQLALTFSANLKKWRHEICNSSPYGWCSSHSLPHLDFGGQFSCRHKDFGGPYWPNLLIYFHHIFRTCLSLKDLELIWGVFGKNCCRGNAFNVNLLGFNVGWGLYTNRGWLLFDIHHLVFLWQPHELLAWLRSVSTLFFQNVL